MTETTIITEHVMIEKGTKGSIICKGCGKKIYFGYNKEVIRYPIRSYTCTFCKRYTVLVSYNNGIEVQSNHVNKKRE